MSELEDDFVPPEPPDPPRRGPGRPKGSKTRPKEERERPAEPPGFSTSRLRDKLKDPLIRIADWLEDRDPEFSAALREDAPKIASLLTKWAASPKCPPGVVAAIRFVSVLLEPLDAFGRVARLGYVRLRDRAAARRMGGELVPFPDDYTPDGEVPPPVEEPPEALTPDRFRADREPPPVD